MLLLIFKTLGLNRIINNNTYNFWQNKSHTTLKDILQIKKIRFSFSLHYLETKLYPAFEFIYLFIFIIYIFHKFKGFYYLKYFYRQLFMATNHWCKIAQVKDSLKHFLMSNIKQYTLVKEVKRKLKICENSSTLLL